MKSMFPCLKTLLFLLTLCISVTSFGQQQNSSNPIPVVPRVEAYRATSRILDGTVKPGNAFQQIRPNGQANYFFLPDSTARVKPKPVETKSKHIFNSPNYEDFKSLPELSEAVDNLDMDLAFLKLEGLADSAEYKKLSKTAEDAREYLKTFEEYDLKKELARPLLPKLKAEQIEKNRVNAKQVLENKKFMDVVHHASVRMPIDTATFSILIGGIVALELIFKNGGDPLAMQKHFESLSDPMAHMSFYSFMLANGISLHYLQSGATKRLMDLNNKIIFSSLPLISMPFASLISNVLSDGVMALQACKVQLMQTKKSEALYSPCDEAKRQWSLETKFNQYAPMLLSLVASQVPFVALQKYAEHKGASIAAYQLLGVETIVSKLAGKSIMFGLKFLVSPLPGLALDMLITSAPIRIAWQTRTDNNRIIEAKKNIISNLEICKTEMKSEHTLLFKRIPKECQIVKDNLLVFRDRNQSWRMLLNADFEIGLQHWSELILKINTQFLSAQYFYNFVFGEILNQEMYRTLCSITEDDLVCEMFKTLYAPNYFVLTRQYPLLGGKVNPKAMDSKKEMAADAYTMKLKNSWTDYEYGSVINAQLANFKEQSDFLLQASRWNSTAEEKKIYELLQTKFQSGRISQILSAWKDLLFIERSLNKSLPRDAQTLTLINAIRTAFGNLIPILSRGSGFLHARTQHNTFKDTKTPEDYFINFGKYEYRFPTTAHYFLHEMICGIDKSNISSTKFYREFMEDGTKRALGKGWHSFEPPRITANNENTKRFCEYKHAVNSPLIDYEKLFTLGLNDDRPSNPMSFLLKNIDPKLFDPIDINSKKLKKPKAEFFSDWWVPRTQPTIDTFFKEAQEDWMKIYSELIRSFKNSGYMQDASQRIGIVQNTKGYISDFTSQPKNSLDVIRLETNMYVDVLRAMNITNDHKRSLRQDEAVINFLAAQNNVIKFLTSVFSETGLAMKYEEILPNSQVASLLQMKLMMAYKDLRSGYLASVTNDFVKAVNHDAIYGMESTVNELTKFLSASSLIAMRDQDERDALQEDSDKRTTNNQSMGSKSGAIAKPAKPVKSVQPVNP